MIIIYTMVQRNEKIIKALVPQMGKEWADLLWDQFTQTYMRTLSSTVASDRANKKLIVRPDSKDVFKAFRETPFSKVNAVIIGQDPYPNHYADGLCFSSSIGWECPKSLKYILDELERDEGLVNFDLWKCFDLSHWAKQGILMLNSRLTVLNKKPGSHANIGWETFIKRVIQLLNTKNDSIIFLLWGSPAKKFKDIISSNHEVVMADHPASVIYSGIDKWKSNNSFSKLNKFLEKNGKSKIEWTAKQYYIDQYASKVNASSIQKY